MYEDGAKRVCTRRSDDRIAEVDRLSNLPECLIIQILLKLPTKDVVKTSLLSSRWRNLWRYVPGLDLELKDFGQYDNNLVSFVDMFLGYNRESCMQNFKYKFDDYHVVDDDDYITRWINTVVKQKVQHLHVLFTISSYKIWIFHDTTVYTCETLVSLQLSKVVLPVPKFVSLPSLKVIDLDTVYFANDLAFERLISGCPVLETLTLRRRPCDPLHTLRVSSKSLLSFTLSRLYDEDYRVVVIDAPRLECLDIGNMKIPCFIINNMGSLVKLQMDRQFRSLSTPKAFDPNVDLLMTKMVGEFFSGISSVKIMNIYWDTLQLIYGYSGYKQLPLFRNLSFLSITFKYTYWEMLTNLLENCPNLKSLSVILWGRVYGIRVVSGARRFMPSLEYVKIEELVEYDVETRLKLAGYFLENSPVLKKFTFRIGDYREEKEPAFLKKLRSIPRLSTSCEIVVL